MRNRGAAVGIIALALAAAVITLAHSSAPSGRAAVPASPARGGSLEAQDEDQLTAQRVDALVQALSRGTFGAPAQQTTRPASGWVGSRLLSLNTDDWEPAVATDPKAPWVYLLTTRYGVVPPGCTSHCPSPFIALAISSDGGSSFGSQVPLCLCLGVKAQYDPVIEVVPDTGAVYAALLNGDRHNGFSTSFTKSTDHGRTWSAPVHVYGNVSWTDKPEIATSASGKDVYISWNGPEGGDLYVGQSHDYGETWTQQKLSDSKRYYYAYDGRVLADGTVVFAESSLQYSGSKTVQGEVWHHPVISRDGGATWEDRVVAKVPVGENCVADGCKPDFYIGQTSVVSDARPPRFRVRGADHRPRATACVRRHLVGRRPQVEHGHAALDRRRRRDRSAARRPSRDRAALVHADCRRRQRGRVERLVPELDRRRAGLVGAGQDLRRARRSDGLRWAQRLRRGLRGLRRDRRHQRGQDIRHVGRRLQLHGPGRHLVQRSAVSPLDSIARG